MQRGRPSGTATSAVPSSGTSRQLSRRAARAGYSAVRSGEDVKIALSTSSGWNPFASWSARNSSAVASRIASRVLAAAVVAPRSPRRILLMALADQLRLMVITDAALLKGRDRKSTRLNSSHGYISYAVFCLKKKKNNSIMIIQNDY